MKSELFEEAWKQNRHVWESTKCLAQAMYLAGEQHQQSKIDELQANFDQHDQWLGQRNRDVQELNDIIAKHVAEKDELQKIINASNKVLESMRKELEHGHLSDDQYKTLSIYADDLEQALKGGSDEAK